jgi:hypothetical protein
MGVMDTAARLAYVFWHWVRPGGEVAAYEHALTAFQRALLDSAPLDPLNDAAVSAACRAAHDVAAGAAAGGTAGLYRLRQGEVQTAEVRCATWFSKPAGMSYEALDACLAECTDGTPSQCWSRFMTLGPTPEMCVLAPAAVSLPAEFDAINVPMEALWPLGPSALERDPSQAILQ